MDRIVELRLLLVLKTNLGMSADMLVDDLVPVRFIRLFNKEVWLFWLL